MQVERREEGDGWTCIAPHRLFNWLQNLNRTVVIDLRDDEECLCSRLTQALHFSDSSLKARLAKRVTSNVVFVHSGQVDVSYVKALTESYGFWEYLPSQGTGYLACTYDEFHDRYGRCSSMFALRESPHTVQMCYPNEIIPGKLFLGNARQASDARILDDLGITHLVDASGMEASRSSASEMGISYRHINIDDTPDTHIDQYFEEINEFIHAAIGPRREERQTFQNFDALSNHHLANNPKGTCGQIKEVGMLEDINFRRNNVVLVHCQAGVSRGCSLVVAYLMNSRYSSTLAEAMRVVLNERPWVCPNPSFRQQLREYETIVNRQAVDAYSKDDNSLFEPSFASDKEHLALIMNYFTMNAGTFHATVFDDTPITAGRQTTLTLEKLIEEDEENRACRTLTDAKENAQDKTGLDKGICSQEQTVKKPKKQFLRRGQGKTATTQRSHRGNEDN